MSYDADIREALEGQGRLDGAMVTFPCREPQKGDLPPRISTGNVEWYEAELERHHDDIVSGCCDGDVRRVHRDQALLRIYELKQECLDFRFRQHLQTIRDELLGGLQQRLPQRTTSSPGGRKAS